MLINESKNSQSEGYEELLLRLLNISLLSWGMHHYQEGKCCLQWAVKKVLAQLRIKSFHIPKLFAVVCGQEM